MGARKILTHVFRVDLNVYLNIVLFLPIIYIFFISDIIVQLVSGGVANTLRKDGEKEVRMHMYLILNDINFSLIVSKLQ